MTGLRSFLWLIALIALSVPSLGTRGMLVQAAAGQEAGRAAMTDCGEHKPPPDDCPSRDTAKHVTGECCAFMCVGMAVMPPDPVPPSISPSTIRRHAVAPRDLAGRHLAKDPPPPRA